VGIISGKVFDNVLILFDDFFFIFFDIILLLSNVLEEYFSSLFFGFEFIFILFLLSIFSKNN